MTCSSSHALFQHSVSSTLDTNSSRIFSAAIATLNVSNTSAPIKSCATLFTVPTNLDPRTGMNTSHRARTQTPTCPLAWSTRPNPIALSSSLVDASDESDESDESDADASPSSLVQTSPPIARRRTT